MNINEDDPHKYSAHRKNFGTELLIKSIRKSDGTIKLIKNISYTTLREVPPIVLTKVIKLHNISMLYFFNNNLSLYHNQRISHDQLCSTNQRAQDSPLKKTQSLANLCSPFDSTMKSPPLQISGIVDLCESPSENSAVQSTLAPQMVDPTDLLIYTFYPVELESQVDLYATVYSLSIRREAHLHRLLSTHRM